jgi:hypothetical protein
MPLHFCSRTVSRCGLFAAFLLVIGSVASVTSQAPAGAPVSVDFHAVNDAGQPVLDLKAADVALKVNGKARELRDLKLVKFEGGGTAPVQVPAAPPFGTNVSGDTREVMIVVDEESLAPGKEQPVREAMNMLVAGLGARDRIGVLSVGQGGVNVAPTTQRPAVTAAIAGLSGHALTSEAAADFTCRSRQAMLTLQGLFSPKDTPARTIVYYSASLAAPAAAERTVNMGSSSGLCQLSTAHFNDFGAAVRASHATLYIVHAMESASTIDPQTLGAGLENLAGVSDSTIERLGGNTTATMGGMARETSAYYVASFDPDPSERNGSTYRVDVHVGREGVKTKARPDLTIPKADAKAATTPRDMIRVATTCSDLPLRGAGYPSRNAGDDKIRVLALFEPADPGTKLTAAVIGMFDDKGKLTAQWTAQAADLTHSPVTTVLIAPPGAYRMRIAAIDAQGRAGTIDYPVRAELAAADPVKLSALVLGLAQNGFTPKLLFTPADEILVGYFEAYAVPKGAQVAATLELAASEDAPPMATAAAKVQNASAEDMRIIYGGFGVTALQPGDYVLRALVTVDGKPAGRLTRTVRKAKQ